MPAKIAMPNQAYRSPKRKKGRSARRMSASDWVFYSILFLILLFFALLIVGMLVWGLLTSFKSSDDVNYSNNLLGWPSLSKSDPYNSREEFFHWANYQNIFKHFAFDSLTAPFYQGSRLINHEATNVGIGAMLFNTIVYAGVGALILAITPAITAYLTCKYDFFLSKVVFFVFTLMMCIPIVGAFPSEITFLRNIGIYDNLLGMLLRFFSGAGTYYFVYYSFFKGQSDTYREAAEIDGAGNFAILFRVYFPMAAKIILTVYVIQFVALWNDFTTPMLYMPTHPTLAYGVYELTKSSSKMSRELQSVPARITACMILALPILVVFAVFHKKLMGNIELGGIKG